MKRMVLAILASLALAGVARAEQTLSFSVTILTTTSVKVHYTQQLGVCPGNNTIYYGISPTCETVATAGPYGNQDVTIAGLVTSTAYCFELIGNDPCGGVTPPYLISGITMPGSGSTSTPTPTPSYTPSPTNTPTYTITPTASPSNTPGWSPTNTPAWTATGTPTKSPTPTNTPTNSPSGTFTSTITRTFTASPTYTVTAVVANQVILAPSNFGQESVFTALSTGATVYQVSTLSGYSGPNPVNVSLGSDGAFYCAWGNSSSAPAFTSHSKQWNDASHFFTLPALSANMYVYIQGVSAAVSGTANTDHP